MAEEQEEFVMDQAMLDELDALAQSQPNEVLFAPPAYARLDPNVEGSWQYLVEEGKNVAVFWTDWQNALGVIPVAEAESVDKLLRYVVVNKMMSAPAGLAYNSASNADGIELVNAGNGPLSGALQSATDLAEEVSK